MLASGSADGNIILWDVATHLPLGTPLTGHAGFVNSVVFSPDGKTLASGNVAKTIILWDVATHMPLGAPLIGHTDALNTLPFTPDRQIFPSSTPYNPTLFC